MKKWLQKLDQKYVKICTYTGVTVIVTAVILALIYFSGGFWLRIWNLLKAVIRPIVIGGIFCYIMLPGVNFLEAFFTRKKAHWWARVLAVLLGIVSVVAAILLVLALVIIVMYRNISAVNLENLLGLITTTQGDLFDFLEAFQQKATDFGFAPDTLSSIVTSILNGVRNTLTGMLFGIVFAIYFLLDWKEIAKYWHRVLLLFVGNKNTERAKILSADASRVFNGYIRGQLVDALVVAVIASAAFLIAGIPYAGVVGALTGLGNLIPYMGPILGAVTMVVVCLPGALWGKLVIGLIILAVVMLIDSNVIEPRLLSSSIRIHPVLVIVALIGGGVAGGFVGMIVSVPVAAFIKVQFDRYLDRRERVAGNKPVSKKEPLSGETSKKES